ncbi:alkaline phosphatase family protein [Halorhabdus tiamatea]|uniref:hypothetical protein n=1 Tax=Halorhabdus tiamatea TaxID=430914 RepID=UPI0011D2A96B|nr:hypothetical protein [Halorhabdus tiamatea]
MVSNPIKLLTELRNLKTLTELKFNNYVTKNHFEKKYGSGINIMQKDWDNLIILDACRYDIFKKHNIFSGELSRVVSPGGHSKEFYEKGFPNSPYHDSVMVTANPYTSVVAQDYFHDIVTTYTGERIIESNSRVESVSNNGKVIEAGHVNNVHPKRVNEISIDQYEKNPNKRLIIHYLQPHDPYFGTKAKELRNKFRKQGFEFSYWTDHSSIEDDKNVVNGLMTLATRGYISDDVLKEVYEENLKFVLEYVADIVDELSGKTVITSDHGELLGEKVAGKQFFHYEGIYSSELRHVPWLSIEGDKRRQITKEGPQSHDKIDDKAVDEHLQMLGYK